MKRRPIIIVTLLGALVIAAFFAALGVAMLRTSGGLVSGSVLLEIDFEAGVIEKMPDDLFARVRLSDQLALTDIVDGLHRASRDDRVRALVARVGSVGAGVATIQEIRDAVIEFRKSGKPAIAWAETFGELSAGNGAYYLATAFDEIYLQPSGDVGLTGLDIESPFLRGTLDKLDVAPQLDHRYEYKNAMNMFTEKEFTPAHREATTALMNSIFDQMVNAIAESRKLSAGDVRELCDRGPFLGQEAVDAGLVDGLLYRDQVYQLIEDRLVAEPRRLSVTDYHKRAGSAYAKGETIALIYGYGQVARGSSGYDPFTGGIVMGSDTVTRAFRDAIDDDDVKAILFRVSSPGGSYVASDAIWRETIRAREAGKPVIVSMGDVAASGGYFVSMDADKIVAHPGTITASIGVLGGKMVLTGLYDKLGLSWDNTTTSRNATMWSATHPYSESEWERLQAWLDRVYEDFTGKVAHGRNLPIETVREIARGRVWTGEDARELGLVDDIGGFAVALEHARAAAGIPADAPVRVRSYPRPRSFLEMVLERGDVGRTELTVLAGVLDGMQPLIRFLENAGLTDRTPAPLAAPDVPTEMR